MGMGNSKNLNSKFYISINSQSVNSFRLEYPSFFNQSRESLIESHDSNDSLVILSVTYQLPNQGGFCPLFRETQMGKVFTKSGGKHNENN
jgi:hypothetical protein